MLAAIVSFRDRSGDFHVARKNFGYPWDIAEKLIEAVGLSYELPKFEPGEMAASFVVKTKAPAGRGWVKFLASEHWEDVAPKETLWRYVVSVAEGGLLIEAFKVFWDESACKWYENALFSGSLADFKLWAEKERTTP